MDDYLLRVHNLKISIPTSGGLAYPVNGASFAIRREETLALLGESGCGKSLTALAIMQLLPFAASYHPDTHILLEQQNLLELSEVGMRKIRGRRIGIIFQEPMTSLNPVLTIGDQIGEMLQRHFGMQAYKKQQRCLELLEAVGIPQPDLCLKNYPHVLSGGMKQRVMIAIALAAEPDLLIADEPTTALDVTIQAQVLDLLKSIQKNTGMSMLFITHDLGVVKDIADEIGVMYAGHIVEQADKKSFYEKPLHPYSKKLFESLPSLEKRQHTLQVIKGSVPPLGQALLPCRFADRCSYAWARCEQEEPCWILLSDKQAVRCHLYEPDCQTSRENVHLFATKTDIEPVNKTFGSDIILQVNDLAVHFPIRKGLFKRTVGYVKAVDGVTFSLQRGKTLALVGESGCGKTTTGRGILRLIQPSHGNIHYQGEELTTLSRRRMHQLRKDIQIIFQDPFSSMNPRMMVGDIIAEGMLAHGLGANHASRIKKIKTLLKQVGLPPDSLLRYPHEFSGGQRQRICIARALALEPKLIICDEPTSALDVSVQAQILNLLKQLQSEYGLSYLFISHDMAVVAYLADEIAVMQRGKIVEHGAAKTILQQPQHAYTKQLLAAVPIL